MRVILLEDIDNLGKKHEVKDVKDGYAKNFLIPKGLAKLATKEALKDLNLHKEEEEKVAEEELKRIQLLASQMDGYEVIIPVKIGDDGQLFESVTSKKIIESLKEMGFEIKKKQFDLSSPIKELGEFPIKIKFEHNLEAEIVVVVVEDESSSS
jgi:large subunit ribosomal protein L9